MDERDDTRRRFWPVAAILVALSVVYCLPLFANLEHSGRQDWDQFTFWYALPRAAILRDHVLPVWNPYAAGGNVLLAHPDSPVPSPWYLIVLALEAPLGLRVQVLVFMALGAVGMAAFVLKLGASRLGAVVGGIVFVMSSHFVLNIAEGHLEWCVYGLMPWVAVCMLSPHRRSVIAGALVLASVLTFGAVYVPAVFLPFFSAWMVFDAIRQRRVTPVLCWSGIVVIAVLVASPKLLPTVLFASEHPREPEIEAPASWSLLPTMFADPRQVKYYQAFRDRALAPGHFAKVLSDAEAKPFLETMERAELELNFHEYGSYIGAVGIPLAILGFAVTVRRLWPLYAAGALAVFAVLGANAPVDVWAALQRLPLYEQLHVPSRFLMAVVFVLAVASAFGLGVVLDRCRGSLARWRDALGCVLAAVLFVELATMGWSLFGDVFVAPPKPLAAHATFAQRCDESTRIREYDDVVESNSYACFLSNSGDVSAYEALSVRRGRVLLARDPAYRGEVYLQGSGTVEVPSWTMSRVRARVNAAGPDRLILNQNFGTGWRARLVDTGGNVVNVAASPSDEGLVSVPVDARTREVGFGYVQRGLLAGIGISTSVLLLCAVALVLAPGRACGGRRRLRAS